VGETQYVSDTSLDQAFVQNPEEDKYLSEVAIPFFIAGDPAGVIDVESTARNGFTGDDIRLLEALSLHVAGAYERVLGRAVKPSGEVEAEKMIAAGKVASMVAHDLRGPLQLIKNMVFLARQNPAKTDLYLTRILDAVNYSGGILEDIRSTLKQTEVAKKPTDLRELLSTSLEALEENGAVRVVFEASELGAVDVDPLKMRRVFDNLIRNAVEAMPHGGQLTVRSRRSGGSVSVTVSDTGEGIPPEFRVRLFRLFETTKRNGTGLGLAYCKQTVEAHGGEIAVESEVGKGTSITVTLPATVP
jgi:signal transduction histidine kinase